MNKVEDVMKKKGLMNPKDKYNFCVGNLYEDGNNYIGMHSDKEKDKHLAPISSLSFGSSRFFDVKPHEGEK
jgi:alkylated DNA repair dioxygenase AlkB